MGWPSVTEMTEPYYKLWDIEVYLSDFEKIDLPIGSIDLVITSPPYNMGIEYASTDDALSWEDYCTWSLEWMKKVYALVASTGRMCLDIPLDKTFGGIVPFYADIMHVAMEAGWRYKTTIVWEKKQMASRTAWGSWKSASAPHVLSAAEMIAVLYKDDWKKASSGVSDIAKQEFVDWSVGMWRFPGVKRPEHPAPFPVELPRRCMKMFSYVGDTILDPFMGSGTTMVSAKRESRKAIGVDISSKYCEIAVKRLTVEENHNQGRLI